MIIVLGVPVMDGTVVRVGASPIPPSVIEPIVDIFDDFILKRNPAFLMPPPIFHPVVNRIDGDDVDARFRAPKFLAENPTGAAGVERVSGDDDRFSAGLFNPGTHGPGFVVCTGDIGANLSHGRFRDVVA